MLEEHIFYQDEDGTKITSVLMYHNEDTYVINEITTLKKEYGKKQIPTILLIISFILVIVGIIFTSIEDSIDSVFYRTGGIFFAISLVQWFFQRVEHALIITFSSRETEVIEYEDKEKINRINDALREAIIFRG